MLVLYCSNDLIWLTLDEQNGYYQRFNKAKVVMFEMTETFLVRNILGCCVVC